MSIMNRPKTAKQVYAFIDSQNLNLGVQKAGWKMDWRKFRQYLAQQHGVSHAYMFIGYMLENEAMYEQLHEAGFLIVLKPTVELSIPKEEKDNADYKPVIKGNIDAELVLYAMKELANYDQAIIVSGDGDFLCLAEYLAQQGKLAHIMTPNYRYSSLFKPFEKYIIRIDQLRRQLEHKDFRRGRRPKPQTENPKAT
jgi:uncharacterized LabA/DUF88 family protein